MAALAPDWPMVTGVDGKVYPGWTLSADDRDFIIATCHHLAHDLGYSQRRIKQFFDERGVPRSAGSIAAYLARPCEGCAGRRLDHDQLAS
jgi:hypothetical protein